MVDISYGPTSRPESHGPASSSLHIGSGAASPSLSRDLSRDVLRLWRMLPPRSMGPETRAALIRAIHSRPGRMMPSPGADSLCIVAAATKFLHENDPATERGDEIMSSLAVLALEGDAAAAVVLANALAVHSHGHTEGALLFRLSDEWAGWPGRVVERAPMA
jgi:hypothetical protein